MRAAVRVNVVETPFPENNSSPSCCLGVSESVDEKVKVITAARPEEARLFVPALLGPVELSPGGRPV